MTQISKNRPFSFIIWAVFIQSNCRQHFFRSQCERYSQTLRSIYETHSGCRRYRELDINGQISFLHHVKMRRGSTHVRCQVKRIHGVTFGEFLSSYIVFCVVVHFPRTRKQGAECLNVFRCCTIGKLQGFKWHFFSVHGYPNGRHIEMLKIVQILFQSTVKRFAFNQSED